MAPSCTLIYILRRDLRLQDNPVFHEAAQKEHGFTHLLPMYIFPAQQLEVSGFIQGSEKSPYPEARSPLGGFWRCGMHRVTFLGESVWDLKETLEGVGSGLELRVGMVGEVVNRLLEASGDGLKIGGVWMTGEEGVEEKKEEVDVKKACEDAGVQFRLFADEKYFIDNRDLPFNNPSDLPDVFTTYRKMVEPLRDAPRAVLPTPTSLLPMPSSIPPQHAPFTIPTTSVNLFAALVRPLLDSPIIPKPPPAPKSYTSAHPFHGGARPAQERLTHLITSGSMTSYKATRNGLLGSDFSTKLSAYLALGCITSRQVHASLLAFEDGSSALGEGVEGFGGGENEGTKAVRFELLWRDYMRLCTTKFGPKLFHLSGFRDDERPVWRRPNSPVHGDKDDVKRILERFLNGTTGMGLIDASQRELYLTGYTSNRARQNVASFLAKHLSLDWRLGAEWYECMLVDHDVSSNWGNWQYVAGVGNDPRGEARVFNPVKQSWDYDSKAEYVRAWIPELSRDGVEIGPGEAFQAWTMEIEKKRALGIQALEWVAEPLKKIVFTVGRKQGGDGRGRGGGNGVHRGGSGVRHGGGEGGMGRGGGGYRQSRARGWAPRGQYAPRGTYRGRWGGGREARAGGPENGLAAAVVVGQGDEYVGEQQ